MKNIAIVSDSSISLTPTEIKETGVYVAPLTVIASNKEYLDQIDITSDEVKDLIRNNKTVTTSQPNLGYMIKLFQELKSKNFDHIFCLPLSHYLSGTYRTFVQAKEEVGLDNMTIVDTQTLVSPIQRMVNMIIFLNQEDKSVEEINTHLQGIIDNNESFLIPKDLKQLKASGRISPTAATMASLLKIKAILKLDNKGETIEKFATSRTQNKAYDIVIEDLIKHHIKPETHYLDLLHCEAENEVHEFIERVTEKIGKFQTHIADLPSSLTTHAGLGTIVIQWSKK